jgi:hypothetical protein
MNQGTQWYSLTKKTAVSLTPRNQILEIFESICWANTKPYAKRLQTRESGPLGGVFDKKNDGRKSRDTVPLTCKIKRQDEMFAMKNHRRIVLYTVELGLKQIRKSM